MTTRSTVTADGTTNVFSVVFPFLDRTHVKVNLDGVAVETTAFSWITDGSIQFSSTPASGAEVEIYRDTPEIALTTYQSGSVLTRDQLEVDSLQALYRIQELSEGKLDSDFIPAPEDFALLGWAQSTGELQNYSPALLVAGVTAGLTYQLPVSEGATTVNTAALPTPWMPGAVFYNGIYQEPAAYSRASDGSSLTFTEALPADGVVSVQAVFVSPEYPASSELITTTPQAAGAVTRTVRDKFSDVLSVKDFGALGDGVTDDTASIALAITHCIASGDRLLWPAGDYLTTASLADLHSVRHSGPGRIARGTSYFTAAPTGTQTNRVYVATDGIASNDGLSTAFPTTLDAALTALSNYGPVLDGIWVVSLAAGTYSRTTTASIPQFTESRHRVSVVGPTVAHPGVPTAILDGGGASIIGLSSIGPAKVAVEYIKFQNFLPSVGGGVYGSDGINLHTNNVHVDNCTDGIYVVRSLTMLIKGGVVTNCNQGVVGSVGQVGTIGWDASSLAEGPIIDGCVTGVSIGEVSSLHVDFCTIKNCTGRGLLVYDNSRSNTASCDFQNNAVGSETRSGGLILDTTSEYNFGTSLANTVARRILAAPLIFSTQARPVSQVYSSVAVASHTGDTLKTQMVATITLPGNWFVEEGRSLRLSVYGDKSGINGTCTIGADLGSTSIIQGVNPGGTDAHNFQMSASIVSNGSAAQLYYYDITTSLDTLNRVGVRGTSAADMSVDQVLYITAQLSNAADTVNIKGVTVDVVS